MRDNTTERGIDFRARRELLKAGGDLAIVLRLWNKRIIWMNC